MQNEAAAEPARSARPQPVSPSFVDGLQLYNLFSSGLRLLPTGCDSIDQLLRGGVREGQVTEIVGESASGKTQLCLRLTAATATRGERVIYIDTTNSFSAKRVLSFLPPDQSTQHALACTTVICPHDVHGLFSVLDHLSVQLSQEHAQTRARLLIIDSISALLSPVVGGQKHGMGHTLLSCLSTQLKTFADLYSIAVVVTNHMVGGSEHDKRPALGEHWRGQPHVQITLVPHVESQSLRVAILTAATISACGARVVFGIGERELASYTTS